MIQMVVQDIQIKMLIFSLLDKFYISPSLVFVKILIDDGQNQKLTHQKQKGVKWFLCSHYKKKRAYSGMEGCCF